MNSQKEYYKSADLHTVSQSAHSGKYLSLTNTTIQSVVTSILGCGHSDMISFCQVKTADEFEYLGRFRLKSYSLKKAYMIAELDENGLDAFDNRSTIYAAWFENEIVATIRLTSAPFESSQLIDSDRLVTFLGENYALHYLEWSRLIITHHSTLPRLLPAIIIYAGLQTIASGHYQHYFGYCTPIIKKLFPVF
ncbi:hypothetical protein [Legionella tunisiensis]|uniref:hypothetical protein n=1 Tax=Legionella tunisiensis TaxID=1034944 RepID=UPI0002DDA28F|nr:hypothetical protein [Legionella tunisiensis]